VPDLMVCMETPAAEPEPPDVDPEKTRAQSIAATQQRIRLLQAAQVKVNQVFTSKLIALEANRPMPPPPRDTSEDSSDEIPPWRLKPDELDSVTSATLRLQGITLELNDAPRIATLLEQQIARERSTLYELQHIEEIAFVNGVAVKVKRRIGMTP
jgi:hypothetical protein